MFFIEMIKQSHRKNPVALLLLFYNTNHLLSKYAHAFVSLHPIRVYTLDKPCMMVYNERQIRVNRFWRFAKMITNNSRYSLVGRAAIVLL